MKQTVEITGKRETQKQQVRKRLMREGLMLFSTRGLEKTTVADIVDKSEVARGTFYNYFPDTQSLFDALIEQLNLNVKGAIQETRRESDNVYDYLFGTFKSYFELIGTPEMIQFHILNQAHIRQSSYQSDIIKTIVKKSKSGFKIRSQNQSLYRKIRISFTQFYASRRPS